MPEPGPNRYVLDLQEIDASLHALAGGKAVGLGVLSRIDGVRVPAGFCVTTDAFACTMSTTSSADTALDTLHPLLTRDDPDREEIASLCARIRHTIEHLAVPADIQTQIGSALTRLGDDGAYAVRSSATAEDLPSASFAGQQDSFLNIIGRDEVVRHVMRCWASLYTERAVLYRARHGIEHTSVRMAVIVQRMVAPQAAGVLFTADPLTGNRKVASIEANLGLGESVVSGLVNPDVYKVRGDDIVSSTIGAKHIAIVASDTGGTRQVVFDADRQHLPTLLDGQVIRLAQLGRQLEATFGAPQDIEWCLVDDAFEIVQSRPITTLFPIPATADQDNHVFISVGHQQMMTDPMKPLGLSVWQLTTPAPMAEAGGRLYVDVTRRLASPASRAALLQVFGRSDPLINDALQTLLDRGDFIPEIADGAPDAPPDRFSMNEETDVGSDPLIVSRLIAESEENIAALARDIRSQSGPALFDFIRRDLSERKELTFNPAGLRVIMAAMKATWWLNENLQAWLGETNAADTLAQSVANNVTSEMGLALLDVADAIRPHTDVVRFLQDAPGDDVLARLVEIPGGQASRDAIQGWLDRYGMRGPGEIDITRPRWSERPRMLVPLILGNIRSFEAGEADRRFQTGLRVAREKQRELLARLHELPDGARKAEQAKAMIDRLRTFIGYREYPKYGIVCRYWVHKQAIMREADDLVARGVLPERDDAYFLRLEELREVVRTGVADQQLVRDRKDAFASYRHLIPPRVLTSEGEGLNGQYARDGMPAGALPGLPVSAGTIEGRARVTLDMSLARLEPGDILVTRFTDPSWTPLFVAIAGLVTEVGGLMTHGAVIAREYGIPAVVGVAGATERIRDGQRIRVHGTSGYVELLD